MQDPKLHHMHLTLPSVGAANCAGKTMNISAAVKWSRQVNAIIDITASSSKGILRQKTAKIPECTERSTLHHIAPLDQRFTEESGNLRRMFTVKGTNGAPGGWVGGGGGGEGGGFTPLCTMGFPG
jgi:hypothetical protein